MRSWKIAALALEGLRRRPLRVTLTAAGVAIAGGALVAMVAFALGLQRQMETPFRALALLNNIQVSPKGIEPLHNHGRNPNSDDRDVRDAPPLDDAALEKIKQLPGVVAAYPDLRVRGIKVRYGDKSATGVALGIPREAALFGIEQDLMVIGHLFDDDGSPQTLLGTDIVQELGFASPEEALGKTVAVEAMGLSPEEGKSFSFARKELQAAVVGVYRAPPMLPGLARRGVLLPVELMKQIPGSTFEAALNRLKAGASAAAAGYATATVRVEHPSDLDRVEQEIRALGFNARQVLSQLKEMRMFLVFLEVLLAALGTVALIVAALGIVNTLLMSVLERYQEIGIYKAIGASEGDLFVLFLTEAGIIGLLGGLGGLVLGRSVSWLLELVANRYAQGQGVEGHLDLFAFPLWLLGATVLYAILISVLAGVYPALRAARIDPIRALRKD
jgi:putative ABC transport system permease protein